MKLYEIVNDVKVIDDLLQNEGELTIEDQQILIDFLKENDENLDKKLEGYIKLIRSLESDQEALENEIDYLSKKKKTIQNKVKSIKDSLKYFFDAMELKEKKVGIFKISIRKNPASLKIIGDVPDRYMLPQPDITNNAKIKEDLKNGIALDFAVLEYEESLQIK
jgi:hypothetical protein